MAASVNRVILVGNLGKDPEIRSLQDGSKVANMTLATSESWTTKDGERKDRTEWHRVVIIGNDRLAEVAEKYLKKGAKIYCEGQIQTRKWVDQQGNDRFSTEIVLGRFNSQLVMLDSRSSGEDRSGGESQQQSASWDPPKQTARTSSQPTPTRARDKGKEYAGSGSDLDDEIPF